GPPSFNFPALDSSSRSPAYRQAVERHQDPERLANAALAAPVGFTGDRVHGIGQQLRRARPRREGRRK
ncbi:hypothetical protein ACC703_38630, partial [Rhizobium ruizarguesonis]